MFAVCNKKRHCKRKQRHPEDGNHHHASQGIGGHGEPQNAYGGVHGELHDEGELDHDGQHATRNGDHLLFAQEVEPGSHCKWKEDNQ